MITGCHGLQMLSFTCMNTIADSVEILPNGKEKYHTDTQKIFLMYTVICYFIGLIKQFFTLAR